MTLWNEHLTLYIIYRVIIGKRTRTKLYQEIKEIKKGSNYKENTSEVKSIFLYRQDKWTVSYNVIFVLKLQLCVKNFDSE